MEGVKRSHIKTKNRATLSSILSEEERKQRKVRSTYIITGVVIFLSIIIISFNFEAQSAEIATTSVDSVRVREVKGEEDINPEVLSKEQVRQQVEEEELPSDFEDKNAFNDDISYSVPTPPPEPISAPIVTAPPVEESKCTQATVSEYQRLKELYSALVLSSISYAEEKKEGAILWCESGYPFCITDGDQLLRDFDIAHPGCWRVGTCVAERAGLEESIASSCTAEMNACVSDAVWDYNNDSQVIKYSEEESKYEALLQSCV